MSRVQILHVTDFHISDPTEDRNPLNATLHRHYLRELARAVREELSATPCCIVATGDFVDRGHLQNFAHAEVVMRSLADAFDLKPSNIAVCIGNHDRCTELDASGKAGAARAEYVEFSRLFANGAAEAECLGAVLCQPADRLWCLMIDATTGSKGEDVPGQFTDAQSDEIIKLVERVPPGGILIVGTHFPVESFSGSVAYYGDDNLATWHRRHIWLNGTPLRELIHSVRRGSATVWLSGDVHCYQSVDVDGLRHFVTGRLGSIVGKGDPQLRRQARLVGVSEDASQPESLVLEYDPVTFESQASFVGDWCVRHERIAVNVTRRGSSRGAPVLPPTGAAEAHTVGTLDNDLSGGIKLVDGDLPEDSQRLQNQILAVVRNRELYTLGRFDTSESDESEVALSWVSIGPLMGEPSLLPVLVTRMASWLGDTLGQPAPCGLADAVLIGIDCWGAVLASQLSVMTGARNFCVAARSRGKHYTKHETVSDTVLQAVKVAKAVVLVSDVVATGRSLRYIYDEVCRGAGESVAAEVRWIALSVIADSNQRRVADCGFLEAHGTACCALRMPIVPSCSLPDKTILPPALSFS